MLNRIKQLIPLTIVSILLFTSTAKALDLPRQATPPGKLKSCQARESAIKTRMSHLIQVVTNTMNQFDRHASRVEKYYTTKAVTAGKTVANYNGLVADISGKKVAVQTALTKAQSDVQSFSCATDPKGQMGQFRQDMQVVKMALKDYRTSIKNLIVAVRGVFSGEASGSGKMEKK